jgi:3-methyladenine DNA glycosylase AlkD
MTDEFTAERFVERLELLRSPAEKAKYNRYFKLGPGEYGEGDVFMGVRMGEVFALAREFIAMPPAEIELLLDNEFHEARAGAMSIMDKQARNRKTTPEHRQALYDLYLRRHDRINSWDLVDLAAQYVIGQYLFDKPRDSLYGLARSESIWERRTAIVSTFYFIRNGQLADTFAIAGMLMNDDEDLVHKATGWALRAAGDADPPQLIAFLEAHASKMPRVALRGAIEHLDKRQRAYFLALRPSPTTR